MNSNRKIRVGIVGANAERGWARDAHLPALRHLPDDFELAAISARTQELADQARAAFGASLAFGDSYALAQSAGIDLVVVAVKVPEHRAIVLAALHAGKHVMCEWPLGRDLAEAEEMAAAAGASSHVMIGLQGLSAPAIQQAAKLVQSGAIGKPIVSRIFSPTAGWGTEVPANYAYLQDKRNGATLETIMGGHTLAAIEAIVGAYTELDARCTILRAEAQLRGTGTSVARSCADHMIVTGRHNSGCVSTLEVVGGTADRPFTFELHAEHGWLRIAGHNPGGYQTGPLTLETSVAGCSVPEHESNGLTGPAINLAASYAQFAQDIRLGTRTAPDFHRAHDLSLLLDHIEKASAAGYRQYPNLARQSPN